MRIAREAYHWLVRVALLLAACVVALDCAARAPMGEGAGAPRDPRTGIMRGGDAIRIDRGRAGACLLLHGWISTPADFAYLQGPLDEAGWDVYAPLHTGHGTRPSDLEGITAQKLLDGARAHYAELRQRYDRVVLVGFSMGGTMATILAAEGNPWKLVLAAPFYGVTSKWYYVLPPRWWHAALAPFVDYLPHRPDGLHVNRPDAIAEVVTYSAFPTDITAALFELRRIAAEETDVGRLRMPVLVVYSPADHVACPSAMEEFLAKMPAEVKQRFACPRSDHYLLHDYDREDAVAAIVEFIGPP